MKRRDFSAQLLGSGLGLGVGASLVAPAQAQAAFVEGTHYVKLGQPLPVAAGGKIDVVEFFWYGCPHCNTFEPALDAWQKKLPADVNFKRVPVAFRENPYTAHQKIFYALEAMGQVEAMHRKVFYAIHTERQSLDKIKDIAAFMAKNGLDAAKFTELFNSFSVQTKAQQGNKLAENYKIDGVPALGVQGRYFTSGSLAGSTDRALSVATSLIELSRKKG